jgi:nucleoside-diphosphate-sugar epimerase
MKRIAVTGATGFVGRHVLDALLAKDVEVVATFRPGTNQLPQRDHVAWVEWDLLGGGAGCFEALGRPDALLHLAWSGLPNYRSLHHFETELPAQYRFLSGMITEGLRTLAVTGTCFEYGMQFGALSEQSPSLPSNPYGFAKDVLRRQLEFLQNQKPYSLTWARLFYMYGEGQNSNSLRAQLEAAVEQKLPVFNMSGGEQLRDFLPVSEVARVLAELASTEGSRGVVNVCSGRPVAIRTLVESWIRELGSPIKQNLGHYPYPDYEPLAFWGDNQKLNQILRTANSPPITT